MSKIISTAKIKSCKIETAGCLLSFDRLSLPPENIQKISKIINDDETVRITVETIQGTFEELP